MWIYQKKLEFPVNITTPDLRMAKALMAQYGGPDSELAAGCRYLTQRFSMPDDRVRATLNDIGREASEMAHSAVSSSFGVSKAVSKALRSPPAFYSRIVPSTYIAT